LQIFTDSLSINSIVLCKPVKSFMLAVDFDSKTDEPNYIN